MIVIKSSITGVLNDRALSLVDLGMRDRHQVVGVSTVSKHGEELGCRREVQGAVTVVNLIILAKPGVPDDVCERVAGFCRLRLCSFDESLRQQTIGTA